MAATQYKAYTGFKDVYYALLTKDDETGVTYGLPKKFSGALNLNMTVNEETATLDVDDVPGITVSNIGTIELEIGVTNIPDEVLAEVLGKTINEDGVMIDSATNQAPYVALGYRRTMNDGSSRLNWLLKGKFTNPAEEATTKTSSGAVEFQTPTVTGTFVKRQYDEHWKYGKTESANKVEADAIASAWFSKVYDPYAPKE